MSLQRNRRGGRHEENEEVRDALQKLGFPRESRKGHTGEGEEQLDRRVEVLFPG